MQNLIELGYEYQASWGGFWWCYALLGCFNRKNAVYHYINPYNFNSIYNGIHITETWSLCKNPKRAWLSAHTILRYIVHMGHICLHLDLPLRIFLWITDAKRATGKHVAFLSSNPSFRLRMSHKFGLTFVRIYQYLNIWNIPVWTWWSHKNVSNRYVGEISQIWYKWGSPYKAIYVPRRCVQQGKQKSWILIWLAHLEIIYGSHEQTERKVI